MFGDGSLEALLLASLPPLLGALVGGGSPEAAASQQGPAPEPLFPEGAPGAHGSRPTDVPTLTAYIPPSDQANGASVVICPGGDYWDINDGPEGHDVARWLNSIGVAAFVLHYRLAPSYHYPSPLQDARRAVRVVKAQALERGLDPCRVGILGFSAGGHLASTVGTHYSDGNPEAEDPINRLSSRPDFMILAYPVISFSSKYTHAASKENLLGDQSGNARRLESLSNEKQVTTGTPPTFIVHTGDNKEVLPENSVLFYVSYRRCGVPIEMHIYEKGGHAFGLAADDPILSSWTRRCADWMRRRGLLTKAGQ